MVTSVMDISPLSTRSCADGRVRIEVFGKPHDFRHLSQKADVLHSVVRRVESQKASRLYLPTVSHFNARITDRPSQFPKFQTVLETKVCEGCFVDGVKIHIGEAFFVASADCQTLVFSSPLKKYVIACHAGLKCLVDYNRIYHEGKIRNHQSVVDRALEFFQGHEASVRVDAVCGIGAHAVEYSATDEMYGRRNHALIKYLFDRWGGDCFAPKIKLDPKTKESRLVRPQSLKECLTGHIDFFALARAQAEKRGVPREQIVKDGVCTYTDGSGSHGGKFHSHKRQMEAGIKPEDGKRNGVLIMYKG